MPRLPASVLRLSLLMVAALVAFAMDVSLANAQSASCSQLRSTLRTFDRNNDFHGLEANSIRAQQVAQEVQDAESAYVRGGCQAIQQSGQQLPRQCRNLARQILSGRQERDQLAQSVETGQAVAQQREALLQEIARFGCGTGSSVTFSDDSDGEFRNPRESVFDRMFGQDTGSAEDGYFQDGQFVEDPYWGWSPYSTTVRTVCVRMSDGYFWPVSYSTLIEYAANDAMQCQAQCPNAEVGLYYYANPGEEPEQMISLRGEPYTNLPNAFRYRTEFDKASTCKPQASTGSISLAQDASGQTRASVAFNGQTFPLPMRDPRRQVIAEAAPVQAAPQPNQVLVADIPLPRRRPPAPGEAVPVSPVVTPTADAAERIVQFGNKRVRIVGPETPYAQPRAAGT